MLEILSAQNTQTTVSGVNYRKYLHQWICLPDMQTYVQARKVNEQLSDVSGCPHYVSSYFLGILHLLLGNKLDLCCVKYKHTLQIHLCVFWMHSPDLLQG